ncbi:helix-turn-helix domain-containing protein [Tardiphaga alba]|nr:helix-turn-helix domain-containing protein [Tardiphaga alba]
MPPPDDQPVTFIDCYTAEFPEGDPESAASYGQMLSAVFDFDVPAFAQSTPFSARSDVYILPDVTLSRARSAAARFTRTARTIAERGTDQILVVCYTSGSFTMTTASDTKQVQAGELAFIDLSQEITIEATAVANISLALSRRKLETMVPFIDDAHGFIREPGPLSRLLLDTMENIMAMGPAIPVVDARAMASATIDLAAACLEPLSRQQVETKSGRSTVSLVAIKSFIERHLSDADLKPQTLIDEFGVTRSTLYRLFEPLGGVSAYITQRKLHRAFRLITDTLQPRQRISQLAFDVGFSHPSAFTRAFKEFFGLSPTDVQMLAGQSKERDVQLLVSPDLMKYLSPIAGPSVAA